MVKFTLKSGKEVLDIEQTPQQSFEDFQAKVFALTDIPPKNLKLLFKGKMIKDNKSLLELPQDSQLIVMGSKSGQQLKAPSKEIKIQAMDIQQNKLPTRYGLVNIGNTCYMNSAIQFLRSIPQFQKLIRTSKINNQHSNEQALANSLGAIFNQLDKKDSKPIFFVQLFLSMNQQFTPFGTQQDSDQFMQKLLTNLSSSNPQTAKGLKNIFEIDFVQTLKNKNLPDQPQIVNYSQTMKLCCSLGGVQKQIKIGTLMEGIKLSLEGELEKNSPLDNQLHTYHKTIKFTKLPNYLLVQMVRFYWREAGQSHGAKAGATKICKSIDFSHHLDIFDFCSPQLQAQLQKGRQAMQINKKKEEENYKTEYEKYKKSLGDTNRPETRIIQQFKQKWKKQQKPVTSGLDTGMYQLTAVVTHLGQSIERGHYMAWVKQTEEQWMKYDDDTVYPQPQAKVIQLRGGQPNLQIAYIMLFKKVFTAPI